MFLLLRQKANSYCAGNIRNYYENWRSINSDKYILGIIENSLLLSFDKDQPSKAPFEFSRTKTETDVLEIEVEKILKKGVISPTKIPSDDHFSDIFTRQKKYDSCTIILNVKYLNEECYTQDIKMESIRHAIYMIQLGIF